MSRCAALCRAALHALGALALATLSGCALLRGGDKPPGAEPAAAPTRPLYRLEVDAPDELRGLLLDHLDLARFQNAPASEAIDDSELRRLAAVAPAQARALLETEGYFGASVTIERQDDTAGLTLLRVHVQPGPQTRVVAAELDVAGALRDAATADPPGAAARQLAALRGGWPLPPGAPFRQSDWRGAKNGTLAKLHAEGYPAASWTRTQARVDAARHEAALQLELDSGPLFTLGPLQIEGAQRYGEARTPRATWPASRPASRTARRPCSTTRSG